MSVQSRILANIVENAAKCGGFERNIVLREDFTVATKCTMFLQVGTIQGNLSLSAISRLGGFTETWYHPSDFGANVEAAFTLLAQKRAALLPTTGSIVGFRYQTTDGIVSGRSTTRLISIPGLAGRQTDVPQMGIKMDMDAANGVNQRVWLMRGVPDSQITTGEFQPSAAYRNDLANFLSGLGGTWAFRGQVLTNPPTEIDTITAAGVITWGANPGYANGSKIKVLRARNIAGRGKGGVFRVNAVVANTGQLTGWTHGDCTGGKSRQYAVAFPLLPANSTPILTAEAVLKKVGRPSRQYRGRRAVRTAG